MLPENDVLCVFDRVGADAVCRACGRAIPNAPPGRLVAICRPEPPKAPSLLQRVKNFAIATAKHVASGMPTCTDEEIIRRHNICMGCEFFKDDSCSKCGCPVYRDKKFVSKLAWADQSCPVGKWGPVNSEKPKEGQ